MLKLHDGYFFLPLLCYVFPCILQAMYASFTFPHVMLIILWLLFIYFTYIFVRKDFRPAPCISYNFQLQLQLCLLFDERKIQNGRCWLKKTEYQIYYNLFRLRFQNDETESV